MKLAEKLRGQGLGKPDFTRNELMTFLEGKLKRGNGATSIAIGRHVRTDLCYNSPTIGDYNPFNRRCLYQWLEEEGLHFSSSFNSCGVEYIRITI